ncbi:uncharacterized protein LOC133823367 [Humulus lupulus]|uniref:uncharacterized protein LOC133823367 n=1 Tax=Humulus lupulus TaxID=3486 RepID=UPI002B40601F|nr:uncharacterized protein LOC133823367 [Humulus lupulus]
MSIKTEAGVWVDSPTDIKKAFLDYYQGLLGTTMMHRKKVSRSIMKLGPVLNAALIQDLTIDFSTQEVKDVIFAIPGLKAPGPDGYSSYFYQDNWNLVGLEVTTAVLSFLNSGKLLREINNTTITLIPKHIFPDTVCDFRPIACCNVIYKAASKMICSRLRKVLPEIITENQGGFVHEWDFIEEMLTVFQFPHEFIQLIMVCVRTPSHGDFISILWMLRGLKLFSKTSGLFPNEAKSAIYCSGMTASEIDRVVKASGFIRASLPFRYLGIPICSKRITNAECGIILEKMVAKIKQWISRNLSYSARATLINSVLLSIHSYWAQIMVMPKNLLKDIEAICRAFLWKGVAEAHAPRVVAWSTVCTPKSAGGLGFRKILEWNIAALEKYVWAIASKKDNLWVKWIHSIYLKRMDWWAYTVQQNCSWYWKKIVEIKDFFRAKLDRSAFMAMKYSIQFGHAILYDQHTKVQWSKYEWERCSIPKHRYILWLALHQKLRTKEYLSKHWHAMDTECLLCGDHNEEISHLFFQCT